MNWHRSTRQWPRIIPPLVLGALVIASLAVALLAASCLVRSSGFGGALYAASQNEGQKLWLNVDQNLSFDGFFTTAELQVNTEPPSEDYHFRWEIPDALGLGSAYSPGSTKPAIGNRQVIAVFSGTGTHQVTVNAYNAGDGLVASATIEIKTTQGWHLPGSDNRGPYRTLSQTGSPVALDGRITAVVGGKSEDFPIMGTAGRFTVYRSVSPGYFRLKLEGGWWCDLFVSPVPSFHVDRPDRDWYLTQFNTETQSNCGPTATAMGINWAKGAQLSVAEIRRMVGWTGDGAVSLEELRKVCDILGAKARIISLKSKADIIDQIAKNRLVIISYNMKGIPDVADPIKDLIGQYYKDKGGHYLTLKGFSLDHQNVIVYDPIPSDWGRNALRYPDGVSMLGRNRYYPMEHLWASLSSRQALVISPD